MSDALSVVSTVFGWIYFFAWSISFWPQAILNFRRQKVTGLSFEFLAYNITGFLFYSTYSTIKYFAPNGCDPNDVQINDLAFGFHAVLLTAITCVQCALYKIKRQRVHPIHAFIVAALWLLALYTLVLSLSTSSIPLIPKCERQSDGQYETLTSFTLIDFLGYEKIFISFIKYCPQLYLNWKRQSTVGWSITNILLDLTGGSFSFAQQGVDSYIAGSMAPIIGNIPKFLLALESIIFDILFIIQHYVLYRHNRNEKSDEDVDGEDAEESEIDDLEKPLKDGGVDGEYPEAQIEGRPEKSINRGKPRHSSKGQFSKSRGDERDRANGDGENEQYLYLDDPMSRFHQRDLHSPNGEDEPGRNGEPSFTSGHCALMPSQGSRSPYPYMNPRSQYSSYSGHAVAAPIDSL